MGEEYYDIDIVKDEQLIQNDDRETCNERCIRWANYDTVLFLGCFSLLTFLCILFIFLVVWAIYNK
jgi:hypothetical protein